MNAALTSDEFRKRVEAEIARRSHIPKDMYFSLMTGRFSDDTISMPMKWLLDYNEFRRVYAARDRAAMLERLAFLGQDTSLRADKARGALVGLAMGDAFGVGQQCVQRDAKSITSIVGDITNGRRPGLWADAAGMTACVAYSLIRSEGMNLEHVLTSLNCWYRYGAFTNDGLPPKIGSSIRETLDRFDAEKVLPVASAKSVNGAIRAVAPIVIYFAKEGIEKTIYEVDRFARLFSSHVDHVEPCKVLAFILHCFLDGQRKEHVIGEGGRWPFQIQSSRLRDVVEGSFRTKHRDQISSTGDAVDTLEAALWAIWSTEEFLPGAFNCVNLGGEAVTLGAVYGQLAGSLYGEIAIPMEWIVKIFAFHGFYDFAIRLLNHE